MVLELHIYNTFVYMHDSIKVQAKMQLGYYLNFASLGYHVSCNVQKYSMSTL